MKRISDFKLLCQGQNGCLFYHSGALYWSGQMNEKAKKVIDLPSGKIYHAFSCIRLLERLLRLEPRFAVPNDEKGYLLSWNGAMYQVDVSDRQISILFNYRPGMHNPLAITHLEGIRGFTDGFIFGDYWANEHKDEVRIYRIEGSMPKCLYTFPAGTVQHIHGITADESTGRVLICTGDSDEESAIWEAADDFSSVYPVLKGDQRYRACAAYVTPRGIVYATDTPLSDNAIYLYSDTDKALKKLYDLPGPCVYSMKIVEVGKSDVYCFATSVEPDSTLPSWRYRFTYKLGVGVKDRMTHIVAGNLEEGFEEIAVLKKDYWPMWLFQFGNVQFSIQRDKGRLYFTPIAVQGLDGKTAAVQLNG